MKSNLKVKCQSHQKKRKKKNSLLHLLKEILMLKLMLFQI